MFGASWLSYFSYYFTRKNFAAVKSTIQKPLGLGEWDLVNIDSCFYGGYAVGQVTSGFLADAIGPRRLVSFGMIASAIATIAFAYTDVAFGPVLALYFVLSAINGLVQATGWPGNGRLMASWFSTVRRGEVMGWWSTCYQAGGLAIGFLAGWLLGFGWRVVYVVPAIYVAAVGVAYAVIVRDHPSDLGYRDPERPHGLSHEERARLRREAWPGVLKQPLAWSLAASYFCLKFMRYAFNAWLPFYLFAALHYDKQDSAWVSTAFDAGGIPFVIVSGVIADRLLGKRRVATAAICLVMLVGALALYDRIGDLGLAPNILGLALIGATLFGADALVSGAAAQDLGGPHAAALACGMINGIGSIGSVVQGYAVIYVKQHYGWQTLFTVFEVMAAAGALALLPFLGVRPRHHSPAP
jgi:OPA family sugar phosphate sensor protein UhpC-like MFS transporter